MFVILLFIKSKQNKLGQWPDLEMVQVFCETTSDVSQKVGVIITSFGSGHLTPRTFVGLENTLINHFVSCGLDALSWLIGLVGKAD